MATNKKPENTIRSGNIKATIWRNTGESGDFFSATFVRPFKDKKGDWKNSLSFGSRDIEILLNVALEAKEWMAAQH